MEPLSKELLGFDGIERAVEGLYRAFLESTLVEFKHDSEAGYWTVVENFRRRELDPFTLPYGETVLTAAGYKEASALATADGAAEKYGNARRFLYFFDVRADFWFNTAVTDELYELNVASAELYGLLAQAQKLLARFKATLAGKQSEDAAIRLSQLEDELEGGA